MNRAFRDHRVVPPMWCPFRSRFIVWPWAWAEGDAWKAMCRSDTSRSQKTMSDSVASDHNTADGGASSSQGALGTDQPRARWERASKSPAADLRHLGGAVGGGMAGHEVVDDRRRRRTRLALRAAHQRQGQHEGRPSTRAHGGVSGALAPTPNGTRPLDSVHRGQ